MISMKRSVNAGAVGEERDAFAARDSSLLCGG